MKTTILGASGRLGRRLVKKALEAGFVISHRSSNLERISWAVSLLNVQPDDCVLKIGFGPGIAIRMLGELATGGMVYGVDRSQLMFDQASQRNKDFIQAGRMRLLIGSASRLPL